MPTGVHLTQPPSLLRNLVLIGGRGSAKSSIARRLRDLEPRFVLLSFDSLIQYESASTIPDLVAKKGWRRFRELEHRVAQKAGALRGALIDAGGGVVVDLDRRGQEVFSRRKVAALRRRGLVVYLQRDVRYLIQRTEDDPRRPPLSSVDSFAALMARREPWYRRAAHRVVRCADRSKDDLAEAILRWYYRQLRRRARGRN
jgi:shikimate kinase